jgi:hypothetical protein
LVMLNPDHLPPTADQQLGSPVFSFEEGWLAGVGLGLLLIMATGVAGPPNPSTWYRRLSGSATSCRAPRLRPRPCSVLSTLSHIRVVLRRSASSSIASVDAARSNPSPSLMPVV